MLILCGEFSKGNNFVPILFLRIGWSQILYLELLSLSIVMLVRPTAMNVPTMTCLRMVSFFLTWSMCHLPQEFCMPPCTQGIFCLAV